MTAKCIPLTTNSNDLAWLSLSHDAGGSNTHEADLTFLGVTPDDLDCHDPDGTDLGWMSLKFVGANSDRS